MANKNLFKTVLGKLLSLADARNQAGGKAYKLAPRNALAQYAATGCLSRTFYADEDAQLAQVMSLCAELDATYIAKLAIYARARGHMKDMPALLLAAVARRDVEVLKRAFNRVVDNGKMLRNFVQIVRSGQTGRKSLGSAPKKLVQKWLAKRTSEQLIRDSVGNDPSLADVVKMTHPKPDSAERQALYAWLIGKSVEDAKLPQLVREFEAFKRGESDVVPDVPFQMLTSLELSAPQWAEIARNGGWQMLRMNLNTLARHGVFEIDGMAGVVAERLEDPEAIKHARVLPYQLMAAYLNAGKDVPLAVKEALQDAMEIATGNVPQFSGKVYVLADVSGSMQSPVTGRHKGASSTVRCVDVAALFAAAILRRNASAEVIAFSDDVMPCELNPRDSIMTNAQKLASLPSGGTNCSAPLKMLNKRWAKGDLVVYVSDNQSWMDTAQGGATATMGEWSRFKSRNKRAKLVCIDLQPGMTTQVAEREDILNVGGFSDAVFELIARFAEGRLDPEHWVAEVEKVEL